jgi:hypothetical protein
MSGMFNKMALRRTWFVVVILFAAWVLLVNALFLVMQFAGVYVVLFDPFEQTFDEVAWHVFFVNALIVGFVIVNYIKKLIRSFKNNRIFSEKKKDVKRRKEDL